jgi:hypothetical protein
MKKSTVLRLLCLALLAVAASFGAFNVTAQPARALQCASTFLGCEFDHIADYGNMICCDYLCSTGRHRTGVCEQI